jgi:hypothetical protein
MKVQRTMQYLGDHGTAHLFGRPLYPFLNLFDLAFRIAQQSERCQVTVAKNKDHGTQCGDSIRVCRR